MDVDGPKRGCNHSVMIPINSWLPGAIVGSGRPERVSTVMDLACPVKRALHLTILENLCMRFFKNSLTTFLIHLFKTSLLCKNNNCHFIFSPTSKSAMAIDVLVAYMHSSSLVSKFFAITSGWALEFFLTHKYLICLRVTTCLAERHTPWNSLAGRG